MKNETIMRKGPRSKALKIWLSCLSILKHVRNEYVVRGEAGFNTSIRNEPVTGASETSNSIRKANASIAGQLPH